MSATPLVLPIPRLRLLRGVLVLALIATVLPWAARAEANAVRRSSSAVIRTLDLDETVQWYQDNLGFRRISLESHVQTRRALLERQGFLLEIATDERATPAPATDVETTSALGEPAISLLVQDVDAETARLQKRGVEVVQEPADELNGSFRTSLISDNGHRLVELREPLGSPAGFHPSGR